MFQLLDLSTYSTNVVKEICDYLNVNAFKVKNKETKHVKNISNGNTKNG